MASRRSRIASSRYGGLADREMEAQVLDSMDIERERGITIKAQTAALSYRARDGKVYNLNLIDTPARRLLVRSQPFAVRVRRRVAGRRCEPGASRRKPSRTATRRSTGVEVVPVLNKIDLPAANPENAIEEIEDVIGIDATDATRCSAKTGLGVEDVLESLIAKVPPPKGDPAALLQALIIDSWFDNYVGVVMLVRIVNGTLRPKDKIKMMATGAQYPVEHHRRVHAEVAQPRIAVGGQVGFIIAGIKELTAAKVGDTVTHVSKAATEPLPGFKEVKPQVFAGCIRSRRTSTTRCANRSRS